MGWPLNDLPKAVAAVDFLRHRSAAAHHLALIGIYRSWPDVASLDVSPDALAISPATMTPELSPHYWRALGYWTARYWQEKVQSLNQLSIHLQAFVPRLDPSVQKYFLQGVGRALFTYPLPANWVPPAELERFPRAYQQGLLEGWGMALGEDELFSPVPWKGQESPLWIAKTKGLSAMSLSYIQQGKAQFDALFESPDPTALEVPLSQ